MITLALAFIGTVFAIFRYRLPEPLTKDQRLALFKAKDEQQWRDGVHDAQN